MPAIPPPLPQDTTSLVPSWPSGEVGLRSKYPLTCRSHLPHLGLKYASSAPICLTSTCIGDCLHPGLRHPGLGTRRTALVGRPSSGLDCTRDEAPCRHAAVCSASSAMKCHETSWTCARRRLDHDRCSPGPLLARTAAPPELRSFVRRRSPGLLLPRVRTPAKVPARARRR